MLGGFLYRVVGLAVTAALALAAGSQLLASVVSVVVATRNGNLVPLVMVASVAFMLSGLVRRYHGRQKVPSPLVILAFGAVGYVVTVTFVMVLPWGIHWSFTAAAATAAVYSLVTDSLPIASRTRLLKARSASLRIGIMSGRIKPLMAEQWSEELRSLFRVIIVPHQARDSVVQLMRNRPLLPVSLTCLNQCCALVVSTDADSHQSKQVIAALNEAKIEGTRLASPLLAEAVLMLPLVDEHYELHMREYRIAADEATVTHLLSLWPERMTVVSTKKGLRVIVPESTVPGLDVEAIPRGLEVDTVLFRDYSAVRCGEMDVPKTS
jgi:uncharacterized membrane protein (UPF0136 family)